MILDYLKKIFLMKQFNSYFGSVETSIILIIQLVYSLSFTVAIMTPSTTKPVRESSCDDGVHPKNSFLWRIEGDPPSYFYGTIHVPYDMVWPTIPQNVKVAFNQSDHIYFELDLNDITTVRELTRCQLLPDGQTLKSVLPQDLYERIRVHLSYVKRIFPSWLDTTHNTDSSVLGKPGKNYESSKSFPHLTNSISESQKSFMDFPPNYVESEPSDPGLPNRRIESKRFEEAHPSQTANAYSDYLFQSITGGWELKRPIWVMLMINSLTERDIKSRTIPVLDVYLSAKAELSNKNTGAIERVAEQCVPLNELDFGQVLRALNHTLSKQELIMNKKDYDKIPRSNYPRPSQYIKNSQTMSPKFSDTGQGDYATEDLIRLYNCGDLERLFYGTKLSAKNTDRGFGQRRKNRTMPLIKSTSFSGPLDKYFRNELISRRNKNMAQRVIDLLTLHLGKRSLFFAFGAGHFMGEDTIINRVREAGFRITHISPYENIVRNIKQDPPKQGYNSPQNYPGNNIYIRQRLKGEGHGVSPAINFPNNNNGNLNLESQFFGYEFPMAPLIVQSDVQAISFASPLSHYSMFKSYGKGPIFKDLWIRDKVPKSRNSNKRQRIKTMTQYKRNIVSPRKIIKEYTITNFALPLPRPKMECSFVLVYMLICIKCSCCI